MTVNNFNEGIITQPNGRTSLEGYGREQYLDLFGQEAKAEAIRSEWKLKIDRGLAMSAIGGDSDRQDV